MTEEEISQNVVAAVKRLSETIPGGAVNIRNLHIKTPLSPAILIYVSLGTCPPRDVHVLEAHLILHEKNDKLKLSLELWGQMNLLLGGFL